MKLPRKTSKTSKPTDSFNDSESSRIYLGLGSNIHDRSRHLDAALSALSKVLDSLTESKRFESAPRYRTNQPRFLNSVATGYTKLKPLRLLAEIHRIESAEGRSRETSDWKGPRTLDIDVLLFGNQIIESGELTVPHPYMYERKFVLLPLLDLSPQLVDPKSEKPFIDFFTDLADQGIYYHSISNFERIWTNK